jgi:TP901 family phage tail tape measure protein
MPQLGNDLISLEVKIKASDAHAELLKLNKELGGVRDELEKAGKQSDEFTKDARYRALIERINELHGALKKQSKEYGEVFKDNEKSFMELVKARFREETSNILELEQLRRHLRAKQSVEREGTEGFAKTTRELAEVETKLEKLKGTLNDVKRNMKLDGSIFQDAKVVGTASLNQLKIAATALGEKLEHLSPATAEFIETSKKLTLVKARLKELDDAAPKNTEGGGLFGQIFGGVTAGNLAAQGIEKGIELVKDTVREAYQATKEYQAALSELAAITGASGFELEGLQQRAESLTTIMLNGGVKITNSASDILTAFKLVGSAKPELLQDGEALQEVTKQTILLAKATGMSLPEAVTAATTILNQFEAPAKDTARYINAIAAGAKEGAAEIPDIAASIKEFGAGAKSANISIEESVALTETLGDKMLKGSEAGTALRNILLVMKAPDALGKDAIKALEQNNVSTKVLSDTSLTLGERLKELSKIKGDATALTRVFGKENVTAGEIVLNNVDRFDQLTTAIHGSNEAYRQASAMSDNLGNQVENLTSNWQRLITTMGDEGDSAFKIIIHDINEVIDDMVRSIDPVQQATQEHKNLSEATEGLTKNIQPLLTEYDNLIKKGNLTTGEQARLESIVRDVTAAVPGVITQFNEYGEALRINTDRARGFIDIQLKMTAQAKENNIKVLSEEIVKLEERNKVILDYQTKGQAERKWFQLTRKLDAEALFEQQNELKKNIASTTAYKEQLKALQGLGADDQRSEAMRREEAALEALNKKTTEHVETTKKATDSKEKHKKEIKLLAGTVAFLQDELAKLNKEFANAPDSKTPEIAQKMAIATKALADAEEKLDQIRTAALKKAYGRSDNSEVNPLEALKPQTGIGNIKNNLDVQLAQAIADEKLKINRQRLEKEAEDEAKHREEVKQLYMAGLEAAQIAANAIFQIQAQNSERRKNEELTSLEDSYKKKLDKAKNNKKLTEKLEKELDAKKQAIEKEAFERNKKRSIIEAIINGAIAITKTFAQYGFTPAAWIAAALQAVATTAQVAVINNQKFAKGGILRGPSHAQGGIAAIDTRTGQKVAEMEGDEPYMILSRDTYRNNKGIIDALLDSSLNQGGAPILRDGGAFVPNASASSPIQTVVVNSSGGSNTLNMDTSRLETKLDLILTAFEKFPRDFKGYILWQDLKDATELVDQVKAKAFGG